MGAKAAVRGGGHTLIANAANLENAITIDLSGMNAVSLDTAQALGLASSQNQSTLLHWLSTLFSGQQ